ncbi:nucleotidyltransferase domain-containing protein [Nitrospira calida]
MQTKVQERIKAIPDRVAGLPGLAALWLFGSFAQGEAIPISDVDGRICWTGPS